MQPPARSRPNPAEPVTQTGKIKIIENGEPLVDFLEGAPRLFQDRPRFHYKRETLIRKSVAEMLRQASENLPKGYKLAVIEGWRPPHIQKRMHATNVERFRKLHPEWPKNILYRTANRYTAPMSKISPPPHTTGGAVDLLLAREDGSICNHIGPYELMDPRCYAFDAKGLSEEARETRAILKAAIEPTGLTNYPSEYWHWSYGDQGWAYRGGHPHALYGPIEPPNWQPNPEDVSDELLVRTDVT
ncbi:MAG: dipeptidase [Armatimonadetes bacterium]|nr:dipeptidase [Armatimonadota bacterium]